MMNSSLLATNFANDSLYVPQSNTNHEIPDTVSAVILVCAILLNTLGIYLMHQQCDNHPPSNQTIIVTSISLAEIVIPIMEGVYLIGELSGFDEDSKFLSYCDVTIAGLFFVYYMVLFLLTLNRLMACVFIYNYRKVVSKRRLILALVVIWVSGVIIALPFYFINYEIFLTVWYKFIYLILDAVILVTAILTYTYVFRTTKAKEERRTSNQSNTSNQLILISFLIILTFILFVIAPDVFYAYRFEITEEVVYWKKKL